MDVEDGLTAYLKANGAVALLIAARIYPMVIPQNATRPAINYQRISTPLREMAHDGPTGRCIARIQLTCEGNLYAEAKSVARACREALTGFVGSMSEVKVFSVRCENDTDGYSETELAPVVRFDVFIEHKEL